MSLIDLRARLRERAKQSLGVEWYLPTKKRKFTTSTRATSDLIAMLGELGYAFREALSHIHYDDEAVDIVQFFILNGYGDEPISRYVKYH